MPATARRRVIRRARPSATCAIVAASRGAPGAGWARRAITRSLWPARPRPLAAWPRGREVVPGIVVVEVIIIRHGGLRALQAALERAKWALLAILPILAILAILLRLPAGHWLLRSGAASRHIPVGALGSIAATRRLPKRSATLRAFPCAGSHVSAALRTLHIAPHTTSVTTKTLHIRAHDDLRIALRNRIASFSLCANTIHRHPLQPHADPPEYLCSLHQ